uniref:Uncharacterized protein n=1 Tax=Ovis aries TaxID=9940 RepID=A0AC11AT71_SHEEP
MSEEVTYADLKFQDSSQTENIQKFDKFEKEEPPVPSHVWRQRALALTVLCLLLLIGLGVLGGICMEKLNKLQNFKEELQRNMSLQLMQNTNSSQKIRNLSIKLEEIATKLCRELYIKNKGNKCKPCPEEWMWHDDNCYLLLSGYQHRKTWQKSDEICSDYNASLLTIKSKRVLEFIKSLQLNHYWLGLSPRKDNKKYGNLDTSIPFDCRYVMSSSCDPMDCSLPASSVHAILQARMLKGVAISFSRDLPYPAIEPGSPALQADSLPNEL